MAIPEESQTILIIRNLFIKNTTPLIFIAATINGTALKNLDVFNIAVTVARLHRPHRTQIGKRKDLGFVTEKIAVSIPKT